MSIRLNESKSLEFCTMIACRGCYTPTGAFICAVVKFLEISDVHGVDLKTLISS